MKRNDKRDRYTFEEFCLTVAPNNLLHEWNYELNVDFNPGEISVYFGIPVWWTCDKGHNWKTLTRNRIQGKGCPYCSNRKVLKGYNDLETYAPSFLSEWNYDRNSVLPSEVTTQSNKKVWWKCKKGHEWEASISSRYRANCPYCGNKKIIVGYNDFATTNPQLAAEWDYDKNEVLPTEVLRGSDGFYWWKCSYGHSWRAKITNRVHGTNCPECSAYSSTSFREQAIYYYIRRVNMDVNNRDKSLGYELDIFIPSKRIAIEYDGVRWHQDVYKDSIKNTKCKTDGIELIRIRECGCPILDNDCICFYLEDNSESSFQETLVRVLNEIGITDCDVDIVRDRQSIYSLYSNSKYEKSLECKWPDIAKEWHPTNNGELVPRMVFSGSSKKVWWKCENGHEWEASIASRTGKYKTGCPICSNRKVVEGINDLCTTNPGLLEIWDYEKNEVLPSNMYVTQNTKIYWKCREHGHSWIDSPRTVLKNRVPCPFCGNRRLIRGFNDLETLEPDLISEWNYEKNELDPSSILVTESAHAWWKCKECGYEWKASVCNRRLGVRNSCPKCANDKRKVSRRRYIENSGSSLANRFPEIAKQWHPTKNSNLPFDASNVGGTVHIKVWWKCDACQHEWEAEIAARTRSNTGCPQCYKKRAGKRILNVTTGEKFQNARVAAEKYGCSAGNINMCCRGKTKTAVGCRWVYIDEM